MAVIWKKTLGARHYEVRRAGASIRLYTNGIFHSQYNPRSPLGGSIWDLLALPALFGPDNIHRILVLGLGGGSVIRTLQALLPNREFVAVEIDSTHIHIAKRYFGVKVGPKTKLVQADAVSWLRHYRGKKFDFILDDLFIESVDNPDRAVDANTAWCKLLLKHLRAKGVLAINFDSPQIFRRSAFYTAPSFSRLFNNRYSLSVPGYENRIMALFKGQTTRADLYRNLAKLEVQKGKAITQRLNATIRRF